jgi:hypothetical protein
MRYPAVLSMYKKTVNAFTVSMVLYLLNWYLQQVPDHIPGFELVLLY